MIDLGSVIVNFIDDLSRTEIFQYFIVSLGLFGVIFLIKKIIFD